jgi:hypothetical protein
MAMIVITTSNSISVMPRWRGSRDGFMVSFQFCRPMDQCA